MSRLQLRYYALQTPSRHLAKNLVPGSTSRFSLPSTIAPTLTTSSCKHSFDYSQACKGFGLVPSMYNKYKSEHRVRSMQSTIAAAMENQLQQLPFLVAILLLFLTLLNRVITRSKSLVVSSSAKLLPSPWGLPVVGSMHHLFGDVPHRRFRDLSRKHGPLMSLKLGEVQNVVACSAEFAREILKTHDSNFAYRPKLLVGTIVCYGNMDIAFSPDGDYWRKIRRICTVELLNAKRVKDFTPIMKEENLKLIREIMETCTSTNINISENALHLFNTITARLTFSSMCKPEMRTQFISAMLSAIELTSGFSFVDLFPSWGHFFDKLTQESSKLTNVHREIDAVLNEIIDEHLQRRDARKKELIGPYEEDLVDVLLNVQESGNHDFPMEMFTIKALIIDMFTGGTETAATTVVWAMTELIRNPKVMEKVQAEVRHHLSGKPYVEDTDLEELDYMKNVIKETLRLHPPVPLLLPRVANKDCNIKGYHIPAGTRAIVNAWAVGRDPEFWDDAEAFKPERFEGSTMDYKGGYFDYIPFGSGRRICPGLPFGVANLDLSLALLLLHFDWKLPQGMNAQDVDMTETFGATSAKKIPLYLSATTRIPLPSV